MRRLIFNHGPGQSVVEFALVLPIMLFLLLGIVDLGRVYTTLVSVESAAREAADYGTTLGAPRWTSDQVAATVGEMQRRACVAASNLPDYVGPAEDCANPSFSYCISADGGPCGPPIEASNCNDPLREPPCRVTVTLRYDFRLIVPMNIEIFGVRYGLPSVLTLERSSTFAMTDLIAP
jgi:Flp pilus assembly protein TadG